MELIRVLLISSDPLARHGLAALLADENSIAVVGESGPRGESSDFAEERHADVACWDLGPGATRPRDLPELETIDAPIVGLVEDAAAAADAVAAGATSVLFRDADRARLVAALRAAAAGLRVCDPELAQTVARPRPRPPAAMLDETLTPRELEVLKHLAQGLSNKEIAQRLGLSSHTAKFHVNAILGKLGASSRSEAIVIAARMGLVAL